MYIVFFKVSLQRCLMAVLFLVGQSPVNGVTELSAWYMCVKVNTPIIPNMVSLESLAYV